jgi:hypothetical protein
MRKLTSSLLFLGATTLVACSFQMQAGDPEPARHPHPNQPPPPATPAATTAAPAATPAGTWHHTGKTTPQPSSTSTAAPTAVPTAPPAGAAVVSAQTVFGGPTVDPAGFKGNIYWIPAGTTKLPALTTMTPNGFLFTSTLNVAQQTFTSGFPGVDMNHKENFAIHYEAPLVVTAESDYNFRLVADDGAQLRVDATTGAPIVDNDGVHSSASSVTGPVHLVVGTHLIAIDYFQAAGSNVALQFFCTKAGGTEQICPTRL